MRDNQYMRGAKPIYEGGNTRNMNEVWSEAKKALSSSTGAILCATTRCCTKGRMDRFFRTARTGGGYYCRHPVDIWIIYGGRRHSQDMALCPLYMNRQGAFTHIAILSLPADTLFREENCLTPTASGLCTMVAHFSQPILWDSHNSEYWMHGKIGNGLFRGGGGGLRCVQTLC